MLGQIAMTTLALLVVTKLVASAACVGLGLPVGLIGPSLVMGAAFGGLLGGVGSILYPEAATSPGFYVMLGMTASQVFRQRSVFLSTLETLGLQYPPNPVSLHLQRAGVASLMHRDFVRLPEVMGPAQARLALQQPLTWVVIEAPDGAPRCCTQVTSTYSWINTTRTARIRSTSWRFLACART